MWKNGLHVKQGPGAYTTSMILERLQRNNIGLEFAEKYQY